MAAGTSGPGRARLPAAPVRQAALAFVGALGLVLAGATLWRAGDEAGAGAWLRVRAIGPSAGVSGPVEPTARPREFRPPPSQPSSLYRRPSEPPPPVEASRTVERSARVRLAARQSRPGPAASDPSASAAATLAMLRGEPCLGACGGPAPPPGAGRLAILLDPALRAGDVPLAARRETGVAAAPPEAPRPPEPSAAPAAPRAPEPSAAPAASPTRSGGRPTARAAALPEREAAARASAPGPRPRQAALREPAGPKPAHREFAPREPAPREPAPRAGALREVATPAGSAANVRAFRHGHDGGELHASGARIVVVR